MAFEMTWGDWDGFNSPGTQAVEEKLAGLKKYLTFDQKQSMSRYEVRLYEWILKKQYRADPIGLSNLIEEDLVAGYARYHTYYYLGYYNSIRKPIMYEEDKYAKEQQKNRARFHSKIR